MPSRHIYRWLSTSAGAALLILNSGLNAQADGPALRRLFPPGAQRGSTIEVAALGDAPTWPVQIWSDTPGIRWEAQSDKGKFRVTIDPDVSPGIHHVRFHDADNSTDALRFVVGTVAEISEPEQPPSLDKAPVIADLPKLVNGVLAKRSEVDVFGVDLKEGETLVASVDAQQVLASPLDATLQVVSERGTVLAQNLDWVGLDPRIVYTARQTGRHYVRIFGFPETPDSTIGFSGADNYVYRLTLARGGWIQAARPLAVSATAETQLELLGVNLPDASRTVVVPPVTTGNAWLAAGDGLSNTFALDVLRIPLLLEQPQAGDGTLQSLPIPASITGALLGPHEVDRYQFTAQKGTYLRFELHSRKLGFAMDGVLRIVNTNGEQLAREDDVSADVDPKLTWPVPADGQYTLEVSDLYQAGGPEWFYRVDATPVESDLRLSVKADHFQAKIGEPLEIEVALDRRDGFAHPIPIAIEGLPDGAECPAVVSEKEGETAKAVKLKLTGKVAFSGPIRVVATLPSDPAFQRTATLASDGQVSQLWLTVKP